jgi:hypothetical protein
VGLPSFTVELASHDFVEWTQNRQGVLAILEYLAARAAGDQGLE